MATLSQLITESSFLLGDPDGNRWTTAVANPPVLGTNDLQYMLNETAVRFNLLTGVYRKAFPVQVDRGDAVVRLLDPNGRPPFGRVLRLEDDQGRALEPMTAAQLDVIEGTDWQERPAQAPKKYIRGLDGNGTVRLWPSPPESVVFTAYVVAEPLAMLGATEVPWIGGGPNREDSPAQYHSALPFYVAWWGLMWNQASTDTVLAQSYRAEFETYVEIAAAEVADAMGTRGA